MKCQTRGCGNEAWPGLDSCESCLLQGETGSTGSRGSIRSKAIGGNQGDRASQIQGDIQGDTPSPVLPSVLEAAYMVAEKAGMDNPASWAHTAGLGKSDLWLSWEELVAQALAYTAPDERGGSPYWHAQVTLAARVLRDAGLVG